MSRDIGTNAQPGADTDPSAPTPWSLPELRVAFALMFAVAVTENGIVRALGGTLPYSAQLLPTVVLELALAGAGWMLLVWRRNVPAAAIGLQPPRRSAVALAVGLVVVDFIFTYWYILLLDVIAPGSLSSGAPRPSPLEFCAELLLGSVVAPILEEFLFRGLLFTGLRHHWGPLRAALVSSALFACFHLSSLRALSTFVGGLLFAIAYQRSGSLWSAVLTHSLTNSLFLSLSVMA